MFILGILSWWYGAGWRQRVHILREKLAGIMDFFSIDLLIRTLFAPFRQISAGKVEGGLEVKMRAFFDRLISRLIGGFVRFFMVIFGLLSIIVYAVLGGISLVIWAFIPLFPVIGIVLYVTSWMPWNL
jgi:hypothetical protein